MFMWINMQLEDETILTRSLSFRDVYVFLLEYMLCSKRAVTLKLITFNFLMHQVFYPSFSL